METIEGLKRSIDSAQELMSVVKTMKSLAAVNIRSFERASEAVAGYHETVELGVRAMLRSGPTPAPEKMQKRLGRVAAVVVGTDQGMCGPINERVYSSFETQRGEAGELDEIVTLAVGERISALVEDGVGRPHQTRRVPESAKAIGSLVSQILLTLDDWMARLQVTRVYVHYTARRSRASSFPDSFTLLPVSERFFDMQAREPWPTNQIPLTRADRAQVGSALVRQYLFVSLFQALADSLAAENAGRLAAMQGAENNIRDRLGELTSRYHQTRQSVITGELLDIVTGFEALKEEEEETEQDQRNLRESA